MSLFLVAGSIAYDLLLQYDGSFPDGIDRGNLDELSVSFVTRHMEKHHGGTAANIAWNLRLLNQDVIVAASVGSDGKEYIDRLEKVGIDCQLITVHEDEVTPTAIVGTDSSEHQITFFHPGADMKSDVADLASIKDQIMLAIISPHSSFAMERTAFRCQELGIPYVFDPGQQSLQFGADEFQRMVEGAKGLIANAYEWSLIQEKMVLTEGGVLEHVEWIIVTRGEEGLDIITSEESIHVDAVPAEKFINPTGAGDAFRAGLLAGLGQGLSVEKASKTGATLASFVVETEGTQMGEIDLGLLGTRERTVYGDS